MSGELPVPQRCIDNDAPDQMRTELLNAVFALADDAVGPSERTLYSAITGALGIVAAMQPYGGLARRVSEHLNQADWPRVFDIILRLVAEFARRGRLDEYRNAVNTVLAAHGVVWDLGEVGRLVRVLPADVAHQVATTVRELADPQFGAARELLAAAQDAFNAVPRRTVTRSPTHSTRWSPLAGPGSAAQHSVMSSVVSVRGAVSISSRGGVCRRSKSSVTTDFGHGNQAVFGLSPAEVDFVLHQLHSRHPLACADLAASRIGIWTSVKPQRRSALSGANWNHPNPLGLGG